MSNYRNQMIAKIQIEYPKRRADLSGEDLRRDRLEFYRDVLGLSYTPASTTSLNNEQLAMVLDRMKEVGGQKSEVRDQKSEVKDRPSLSNCTVRPLKPATRDAIEKMGLAAIAATQSGVSCGPRNPEPETLNHNRGEAEIVHLAGTEQAWACTRVMDHLQWPDQKRREYIAKRFHRTSEKMLKPDQARRLLVQLLTIAAHAELKLRLGRDVKISRDQTDAEIPAIKRKLGIDQRAK